MFERFTDEARAVVVRAQQEARDLRADRIDPAHLLLGVSAGGGRGSAALAATGVDADGLRPAVARAADPLDADALAALGVDLGSVRATAEAGFGPGALDRGRSGPSRHLPFSASSKKCLEHALRYALSRKERRIDDAHMLAGVLAVDDPTVGQVLRELGTDAAALRARLDGRPEVA